MNVVVDLNGFQQCNMDECETVCGTKNKSLGYCDEVNNKVMHKINISYENMYNIFVFPALHVCWRVVLFFRA
jgi:hypothetical protein